MHPHSSTPISGSSSAPAVSNDLLEEGIAFVDAANDNDQTESGSPLLPRPRPRRLTTTSDIAHRKSTSMVLFGIVLLTMQQTMPALQDQGTRGVFSQNTNSDMVGRVFARSLEGEQFVAGDPSPPADQNIIILGRIFAWVCTVFYLSSRMPQLWKNFKRKSVQGLSILMFFWAAMGNLMYSLSILNSADAANPDTRQKFLREAVPYLLGSSGTLMFDVSIFGQWLYYTGKLHIFGIGLKSHRHHHRHRHYHPRQSGRSRSQSRVESMVLSPSGSQSGRLYSILVNEEDDDAGVEVDNLSSSQLFSRPIDVDKPRHEGQNT
ncbi:hypothetical protein BGX27_008440 [Mortierella sp. AM989]|nr:hypothetical protein BGX27_008440 [Mortierella sp. AM989]